MLIAKYVTYTELECLKLRYRFDIPGSKRPSLFSPRKTSSAGKMYEEDLYGDIFTYPLSPSPALDDLLSGKMGSDKLSYERNIKLCMELV